MKIEKISQDEFLKNNRITEEDFRAADISYELLRAIGIRHEEKMEELNKEAEHMAARLQSIKEVHSVRWRVKDPEHLMAKIIRKRKTKPNKYDLINPDNYTQIITDLIGVRVLHLFKNEWLDIHKKILDLWNQNETPVAYTRKGDDEELNVSYVENGCKVDLHPAAYRSIHYIISSNFTKREILCEVQLRTIFEEGWSEIDHRIRYPNFSEDRTISYYLQMFNRLAGSADEMGTFINLLSDTLKQQEQIIAEKNKEQEALREETYRLMEQLGAKDKSHEEIINKLKNRIDQLSGSIRPKTQLIDFNQVSNLGLPSLQAYEAIFKGWDQEHYKKLVDASKIFAKSMTKPSLPLKVNLKELGKAKIEHGKSEKEGEDK